MNKRCPFCKDQRKKALHPTQAQIDGYYATCGKRSCISKAVGRSKVIPKTVGKKYKLKRNLIISEELRKRSHCECGQQKKIGDVHCPRCTYLASKRNKENAENFNRSANLDKMKREYEKDRLNKIFDEVTKKVKKNNL